MSAVEIAHMRYTDLEAQLMNCLEHRPDLPFLALSREAQKLYDLWEDAKRLEQEKHQC